MIKVYGVKPMGKRVLKEKRKQVAKRKKCNFFVSSARGGRERNRPMGQ